MDILGVCHIGTRGRSSGGEDAWPLVLVIQIGLVMC